MSITLATHLKTSRHGIYYFRYTVPAPLRPYFGKKEVMYSLHTRDLAIVLDLFNHEVVGWSLKPRMTADIVTDALTMAWFRKKPAAGLMHHSDRGSQYASQAFQGKLKEYGMICSMSRKGNCWDNAPTESWFISFKNERVHGLRFETRAEMIAMSFAYIEVLYNRKRQHSTLCYKSPIQFLNDWLIAQQQMKLVA
jgi:transposase InsO family protein